MNVTVLIVCTVPTSRVDVSGEFSRFFSVFCIIKYLLHMQCIGNIMCHCGTKSSVTNQ